MKRMLCVLLVLCVGGCSVVFQDSVRSSGTACSTSRFWYASDFLMAAGIAYLVATEAPDETGGYVPVGVLALSGAIGVWKRGNCVRHQETATPEQWARDSAREAERDAARAEQLRNMTSRMQQPPSPAPQPVSTGPGPSGSPPTSRPARDTSNASPPSPPPSSTPMGGACRCRGYPVGHPRASEQRPESCSMMEGGAAASCDSSCKAQGYAIGVFRSASSC